MGLSENLIPFGYYVPVSRYHKSGGACIIRPLPYFNFITNKSVAQAVLPTNIYVKDDILHLYISIEGCPKENVDISLNQGFLCVSIKPSFSKSNNYIINEFASNQKRTYVVPKNIRSEDLNIDFGEGILHIQIPINKGCATNRVNF
jgi:HSP20 family molecular chaperone IbpA